MYNNTMGSDTRLVSFYKVISFLSLLIFLSRSPLFAQEQPKESALGVSPAIIEVILEPGIEEEAQVIVFNVINIPLPIKGSVKNFVVNEELIGEDAATREKFDASEWFTLEPSDFIIQPNEEKEITIKITAPEDASPGGHYATIFFEPLIPEDFISSTSTYLTARVGVLGFLVVKGDIEEAATITGFGTEAVQQYGPINFDLSVINQGNVHLLPSGEINISDIWGRKIITLPLKPVSVLPQTERVLSATWNQRLLFGKYKAQASLRYGSENYQLESSEIEFWVFPWMINLAVVLGLILFYMIFIQRRKQLVLALKVLFGKIDISEKPPKKEVKKAKPKVKKPTKTKKKTTKKKTTKKKK